MKLKKVLALVLCVAMVLSTMGTVAFANNTEADAWDGTVDTSWYNAEEPQAEYIITTAEQLAGLAELVSGDLTFKGVTFKLANDIDLYCEDTTEYADGDPLTFRPIGDKSKNGKFEGVFDGDGHTISNLYQNGWDLGYEWGKYGSYGLFGNINDATIMNLNITGSESYIEGGDVAGVTGSATGTCVFENITITDSDIATYNNGCGGIIGWSGAGNYTFTDITIAEDVTLAGLWGSFDSSIGGIVGQAEPGATYNFNNVDIACRLDIYNDVTASYDYYNYRMCGMIIGRLEETTSINGKNYPDMSKYNITCNNVNVTIGDWANYHYCRAEGARGKRVEPGYAYDGLAEDYDHSACTVHHMESIAFNALFGGDQFGVKGADEKILKVQKFDTSSLKVTDKPYLSLYATEVYKYSDITGEVVLNYDKSFATLQEAIDYIGTNEGEYVIKVIKDITESVKVTQNPNQKITITGDENNKPVISGSIQIDGKSANYATAATTIENIVFNPEGVTGDRVIGVYDGNTRYTSNVTISNCDFIDETGSKEIVAIKQSTGGCHNWLVKDCTAAGMHSLIQAANIEEGFIVEDCVITECKNGININSTENFTMTGTTVNTDGYGIRAGSSKASTTPISITLTDNIINAGAVEDDDAAIVLRAGAGAAEMSITSGTYNSGNGKDVIYSEAPTAKVSISGGLYSSNVDVFLVDGYELTRTGNGYLVIEDKDNADDDGKKEADSISVGYKDVTANGAEGEKVYEVVVKANEGDKINELASVDLSFVFTKTPVTNGDITFTVAPAAGFAITEHESTVKEELNKRYMFNYNGVGENYQGSGHEIPVGTITVTGYGSFGIATDDSDEAKVTNVVNATTLNDNLVDSYTANGATDENSTTGGLLINEEVKEADDFKGSIDAEIAIPVRTLTINIDFPNAINDNESAYQDMKVEITGNIDDVNQTVTYNLGKGNDAVSMNGNCSYVVNEPRLVLDNAYTVTVSGAGYRTARYTVTMTDHKSIRFWNNVMDNETVVEEDKHSEKKNFLAGDIVKDNNINIYDLSAVVSYFGTDTNEDTYDEYAKYDLNRDGVIDSKDVAYVLVSWGE